MQQEEEPCLFKLRIFGATLRVDQCLLFRLIAGTGILVMTIAVFVLVGLDFSRAE